MWSWRTCSGMRAMTCESDSRFSTSAAERVAENPWKTVSYVCIMEVASPRDDSYQCLCVGKMEGFASCCTCTMNVFFSSSQAEAVTNSKTRMLLLR